MFCEESAEEFLKGFAKGLRKLFREGFEEGLRELFHSLILFAFLVCSYRVSLAFNFLNLRGFYACNRALGQCR